MQAAKVQEEIDALQSAAAAAKDGATNPNKPHSTAACSPTAKAAGKTTPTGTTAMGAVTGATAMGATAVGAVTGTPAAVAHQPWVPPPRLEISDSCVLRDRNDRNWDRNGETASRGGESPTRGGLGTPSPSGRSRVFIPPHVVEELSTLTRQLAAADVRSHSPRPLRIISCSNKSSHISSRKVLSALLVQLILIQPPHVHYDGSIIKSTGYVDPRYVDFVNVELLYPG